MRVLRKYKKAVIVIVLLIVIAAPAFARSIYQNRLVIIQHPLVMHFIPLYHSLRKLPDIFFAYYWFRDSALESFSLTISPQNINKLNSALPKDPFGGDSLSGKNKVWVSAYFEAGDYVEKVKVRYRGNKAIHWNSYKKSYLIKFPKEHLFSGMRELTLIIPSDRLYFATSLNHYRAQKMGLTVPRDSFVRMNINGAEHGVYLAMEHWSQEWLEKNPVSADSIIFGVDEPDSKLTEVVSAYSEEGLSYWKSWNSEELAPFAHTALLVSIVSSASDEQFAKLAPIILDVDAYYALETLSVLAGNYHNSIDGIDSSNIILIFDGALGKFIPVPYNTTLSVDSVFENSISLLQSRLFSVPAFKEGRLEYIQNYIEQNKDDDIAFLDSWIKTMRPEFYGDRAKLDNNFTFKYKIGVYREAVLEKFNDIDSQVYAENIILEDESGLSNLEEPFEHLLDVIATPREFTRRFPVFLNTRSGIVLPSGTYFFSEDVIIPAGTKLILSPRTTIFMGRNASIVSYSPVEARSVTIQQADNSKPWGVFAVINTEAAQSIFDNVTFRGGGEDNINGVFYSGMLALHNADGVVEDSHFENAYGDDGVNIKIGNVSVTGSQFVNNISDGLDIDFPSEETFVAGNKFFNNGGDAIDLSFSHVAIEDNIIVECGDKGISVGEKSRPSITNNIIAKCDIGIAVKDLSEAVISENIIVRNRIGISVYQKKPIFGGGIATVKGGVLWGNKLESDNDLESVVTIDNVDYDMPDLSALSESSRASILRGFTEE